jgi:hypothetical protein
MGFLMIPVVGYRQVGLAGGRHRNRQLEASANRRTAYRSRRQMRDYIKSYLPEK